MDKVAVAENAKQEPRVDWLTLAGWVCVVAGAIWLSITLMMGPQGGQVRLLNLAGTPAAETLGVLGRQWYLWPAVAGLLLGVVGMIRKAGRDARKLTIAAAVLAILCIVRGLLP